MNIWEVKGLSRREVRDYQGGKSRDYQGAFAKRGSESVNKDEEVLYIIEKFKCFFPENSKPISMNEVRYSLFRIMKTNLSITLQVVAQGFNHFVEHL